MKLYGFPPSPNTRKVQAVVAALEMPVEFAVVDLGKGEQRKPERPRREYARDGPSGERQHCRHDQHPSRR